MPCFDSGTDRLGGSSAARADTTWDRETNRAEGADVSSIFAPATESLSDSGLPNITADQKGGCGCGFNPWRGRSWVQMDYLLWFTKGNLTPAL